jgi:hypothetical protein
MSVAKKIVDIPWAGEKLVSDQDQLCDNAKQIHVRAVSKTEVPQLENFRKRRSAGTHSQHASESIDAGLHAFACQVGRQFGIYDGEDLVDQSQTSVDAIHGASYITRALDSDEAIECSKGLCLATSGVQERGSHDVHALNIADMSSAVASFGTLGASYGSAVSRGGRRDLVRVTVDALGYRQGRRRHPSIDTRLVGIVQLPGNGIENTRETVFGDATAEQRVCGQGAERVVADLGIGRRGTLSHKIQVAIGTERRHVEQDEPDIDAQFRLEWHMSIYDCFVYGRSSHHAIAVAGDSIRQDGVAQLLQASLCVARRSFGKQYFKTRHVVADIQTSSWSSLSIRTHARPSRDARIASTALFRMCS